MTRKEALFEIFKKPANHKGELFPYNNREHLRQLHYKFETKEL